MTLTKAEADALKAAARENKPVDRWGLHAGPKTLHSLVEAGCLTTVTTYVTSRGDVTMYLITDAGRKALEAQP